MKRMLTESASLAILSPSPLTATEPNAPMTTKQKTTLLKLLNDSWSRAYKAKASSEILSAIEAAIAATEAESA